MMAIRMKLLPALYSMVFVGLLFGLLEVLSFFVLKINPTANPLAYSSDEAALSFYLPTDNWHFFTVAPRHRQVLKSDEFETVIEINNIGLREAQDINGESIDIGFAGDSFTFGYGVNYGERYSDQLRMLSGNQKVVSYSFRNGNTTPQYYLFLKNNPDLVPNILVIGLFPWNDFRSDISSLKFNYDEQGELVSTRSKSLKVLDDGFLAGKSYPGSREPEWRKLLRETNIGRIGLLAWSKQTQSVASKQTSDHNSNLNQTRQSDKTGLETVKPLTSIEFGHFDMNAHVALHYLEKINRLMEGRGGKMVVFYIPASYVVGEYKYFCEYSSGHSSEECSKLLNEDYLGGSLVDWSKRKSIALVNPVSDFREVESKGVRTYYEKDGHWSPLGHKLAGKLLFEFLYKGKLNPEIQ
jgi:hypothetical protein